MHHKRKGPEKNSRKAAGLRGRIWFDGKEGTFLGYGRIVLLERIREHGSITKAAKSMDMSYRHAWELVDSMNRQAAKGPLVKSAAGGRGGGGAALTTEGERYVRLFWQVYEDFQRFLEREEGLFGTSASAETLPDEASSPIRGRRITGRVRRGKMEKI